MKTIHITTEIRTAFEAHLNEQIDSLADGRPILRKETFPHNVAAQCSGIVEFAAGWHAALAAKPAQEALTDEAANRMISASEVHEYHPGAILELIRSVEQAHGIGIKKDGTT